jgi:putative FmdB family regulatory protein
MERLPVTGPEKATPAASRPLKENLASLLNASCMNLGEEDGMPLYEFRCNACGKEFEVILSVKDYDSRKVKCMKCGSSRVERVWSEVHVLTSKKS